MRIAGLITLAILLSSVFSFFPCARSVAEAAALININTADAALLDTLPGIGPTKAAAIVDYRTTNGPFTVIEDLQKVSGIGNGVTYANIAPLITVSDAGASDTTDPSAGQPDSSATTTSDSSATDPDAVPQDTAPTQSSSSGGTVSHTIVPTALTVNAGGNQNAIAGVPLRFNARVTVKGGAVDRSARVLWGFGDGSSGDGTEVEKTYPYPGTYLVVVTATEGSTTGRDEFIVTVRSVKIRVLGVPGSGIMIANDASERLDLSGWEIIAGGNVFRIPNSTVILPKMSVVFPSSVTNLPTTLDTILSHPNGAVVVSSATSVAPSAQSASDAQLSQSTGSSNQVQTVEPITSTEGNIQENEHAVGAPAAANELAAAGAAVPPPAADTSVTGLLHSRWTLGLLGVIAAAGGAFILL